jgi:hypothetical protein
MDLLPEAETTKAKSRQDERRQVYAAAAGERLRGAENCQFSLLPYEELVRVASTWYDAAAEAMLRGNYSAIDDLIRAQTRVAAEQGFELDDLLELLRLCRRVAIEKDGWNEDQFTDVDAVIDDALAALRGQVAWEIPAGLNYVTGQTAADREQAKRDREAAEAAAQAAQPRGERRVHGRNKLRMPIRIRGVLGEGPVDEVTRTENVAKGGVYFLSDKPYFKGAALQVVYPYWTTPGAVNKEYPAEVVRLDEKEGKPRGIAVRFKVSLGSQ